MGCDAVSEVELALVTLQTCACVERYRHNHSAANAFAFAAETIGEAIQKDKATIRPRGLSGHVPPPDERMGWMP